jgi:P27 family predicted phage terminase small subunit
MPRERKPADRRQPGSKTHDIGVVRALPAHVPAIPKPAPHWREEVVEGWNDYWSSPMAGQVTKPTDAPALRRLFDLRHRYLVALDAFDAEPIVVGSTGQPTMSPWAQEVHRLEAAVSKGEDKFGLTPSARLKLGVTYEEGVSLAARNADLLRSFQASQQA